MDSRELFRGFFKDTSPKEIAAEVGLSVSQVERWARPGEGYRTNPADRMVQVMRMDRNQQLIRWLCQQADGTFVPNPPAQPLTGTELLPATSGVMQELGLLQAVVAEAVKDCQVSPAEAVELRQKWEVLKSDMEAYLRAGEENRFNPLPARAAVKATMEARN